MLTTEVLKLERAALAEELRKAEASLEELRAREPQLVAQIHIRRGAVAAMDRVLQLASLADAAAEPPPTPPAQ